MLAIWVIRAVSDRPEIGSACLAGVWRVAGDCFFFPKQEFDAIIKSDGTAGFSIDIDPSRWSHSRFFTFGFVNGPGVLFTVREIRLAELSNLSLIIAPKCRIHSNSTFQIGGYTFFGIVKSGRGVLTVIGPNSTTCDFSLQKELKHESWRFSFSLLSGIAAMYIGCQALLGWKTSEVIKAVVIPMDNPGHEYHGVDDHGEGEGFRAVDRFNSDDGY
jgi:hypothetical protein